MEGCPPPNPPPRAHAPQTRPQSPLGPTADFFVRTTADLCLSPAASLAGSQEEPVVDDVLGAAGSMAPPDMV